MLEHAIPAHSRIHQLTYNLPCIHMSPMDGIDKNMEYIDIAVNFSRKHFAPILGFLCLYSLTNKE